MTERNGEKQDDPVLPVMAAYQAGQYAEAEAEAARFIQGATVPGSSALPGATGAIRTVALKAGAATARSATSLSTVHDVARARQLMAFSAARRKDFALARERFGQVVRDTQSVAVAGLGTPTESKAAPRPMTEAGGIAAGYSRGPRANLEESAAYQHAVCTAALGDKAGAEKEWVAFMRRYPESPLVHAAVKRIARLHGGDIPKEADAAWKQAMATVQARQRKRERAASLCGPECLAELIRRNDATGRRQADPSPLSVAVRVEALALEMGTDRWGTTVAAFETVVKRHGYPEARSYALTPRALAKQKLPVVALIAPGHFVLVEKVGPDGSVTFWDSNRAGQGEAPMEGETAIEPPMPSRRTIAAAEWAKVWIGGAALVLHPLVQEGLAVAAAEPSPRTAVGAGQ